MNIDVRNVNIWKNNAQKNANAYYYDSSIDQLELSVRSFNCLRRAGCVSIGDVKRMMGDDGLGLRNIRNLGKKSEDEILKKMEELETQTMMQQTSPLAAGYGGVAPTKRILLKPNGVAWNRNIDTLMLSPWTAKKLHECGVNIVGDLYSSLEKEPGWYAVRELFERIIELV